MALTKYWAWAPPRRRPRRVQKKIDARGGAEHYLPRPWRYVAPVAGPFNFHILRSRAVIRPPSHIAGILWFKHASRQVRESWVGDVWVSTVFLGLDHGFYGRSLWFETMVFDGPLDQHQRRYETWEEAVEGHELVLAELHMELRSTRAHPPEDAEILLN